MKIKQSLFLFFFIAISGFSQDNNPTYKDIVTELFKKYDAESVYRDNSIQIEKREIGWNVTTIYSETNDTITELFWDNSDKLYKPIKFPRNRNRNTAFNQDAISNFIDSSAQIRFNSLKYYGYVGWDEDLIKLYENKNPLTDLELYSLGYAYSNYANAMLNDNFEFDNAKTNFNLPISKNSMTNEQLQTYLSMERKAINCYKKLFERNPNFETIPGQIGIKYYNEIASNFLSLRIYQNEEVARNEIQGMNLYSDNYKLYAKNMLDSCDENAILFTAGDNDTFPLLIYQVQNNYRKDVLVVNTSLLQDERYVLMMMNNVLDSKGIPSSLSTDFIKDELSEVLLFEEESNEKVAIENLNQIISNDSNLIEGQTKNYKTIPSKNFSFGEGIKNMEWFIDELALYRNHLILLDIIGTNKWERPIYFADFNSKDNYLGLSEYLKFEGYLYKLSWEKGIISDYETGYLNVPKLEENCKKMFQFSTKNNLPVEERQLVMNHRSTYLRLANYYYDENQFEKAEAILDESIKLYPNELGYFSFEAIWIIECYYKLKQYDKATLIEKQLLQNFKNKLDNYSFLSETEKKIKYDGTKEKLENIKIIYLKN